jgi:hypothetical protein
MTMDTETLRNYIGASALEDDFIGECLTTAELLVNEYCGKLAKIPQSVKERCYLEVGSELYHRRTAPMGVAQFATFDAAPVRIARDPLVGVYPILDRYIVRFG